MKEPNPPTPFPKREGGEERLPTPPVRNIVRGQWVEEAKVIRARQLRREMTPAECRLWERLRRNQLDGFHFRRQQVIDGFIADFYCHAAGLVVEVDGPIHDTQGGYDVERDRIFAARGLCILRVRNDEVFGAIKQVLRVIAAACGARVGADSKAPNLPPPFPGREGGE